MATLVNPGDGAEKQENAWLGTVKFKVFTGGYTEYVVEVNHFDIKVRLHSSAQYPVGGNVVLKVAPEHCLGFPRESH